ncbi:chitin synthase chs-2-like [Pseudophryne corroboree]|uniref:chitin synthase chs-2-like n=1 Tax=Pseudophryne corroboree TaxID=495146 RepID=UPI0030817417
MFKIRERPAVNARLHGVEKVKFLQMLVELLSSKPRSFMRLPYGEKIPTDGMKFRSKNVGLERPGWKVETMCLLLLIMMNGEDSNIVPNKPLCSLILGAVLIVPYTLTFVKSLWKVAFTHSPNPSKFMLLKVFVVEFLVALGSSLLIIVAMPHFTLFTNITVLCSVYFLPAAIQIYNQFKKKNCRWFMAICSFVFLLTGHILFFFIYYWGEDSHNITFYIAAIIGTILVSINWYENVTPQGNAGCDIKPEHDERNVLYMCGSIVRIMVTVAVVGIYVPLQGQKWDAITTTTLHERYLVLSLFGIQAVSSALCHWFGVVACKMRNVKKGFYFPLISSTITVILALVLTFIAEYQKEQSKIGTHTFNMSYFCQNTILYDRGTVIENLFLEITYHMCQKVMNINTSNHAIVMFISGTCWYIGSLFATYKVCRLKVQRIERTTKLFGRRLYEAAFIDQSSLLNIRIKLNKNTLDSRKVSSMDNVMIYLCATMWHETFNEMLKILTSIFRLDKYKSSMEDDTVNFEAHIYFDDAFVDDSEYEDGKKKRCVNRYVEDLVAVIEDVYSYFTLNKKEVYESRTAKYKIQTIVSTPYGGRLRYTLPCGNLLYVHLKDKQRIRNKKRWSQIMYLYYLLGWKLNHKYEILAGKRDKDEIDDIEAELELSKANKVISQQKAKSNTYILALDGDTDFQPSALMLLVDRLKMYPHVGAACGRIHPTGTGPMIWYQKFEYAVGHWLQKSSEHVMGCVLCSPGCFSLFRASALMDDNVLKKYSTKAREALEYVQYDQGEDRWLCTLLLQQGWRVEYNAASDAYTNAPQEFQEFYNQRRRWGPSTMANTIDLLHSGRETSKKNPSVSNVYILYQTLTMAASILSPATMCLMIAGSFSFLFQWTANVSIVIAIIPPTLYIGVCYLTKPSTQINIAAFLSVCYAFLMTATLLCIIADMVKQQTFVTPTGLFLISMIFIYLITALLHPNEFFLLVYGLVYSICVPSGYLLLTIYSLVNMHIVSWGTRETVVPKDKTKQSKKIVKYQKTCNCFCWDVELQVHDKKCEDNMETGDINEDPISPQSDQTKNDLEDKEDVTYEETQCILCSQAYVSKEKTKHLNTAFLPLFLCLGWISQIHMKTSHTVLQMEILEEEEITFWEDLIKDYLEPIIEDKQKQAGIERELKSLRNKATFLFFLINLLWIVATFILQIIGSSVSIVIPKVYPNGTVSLTDKLYVEPIAFMFVLSFAILLLVQFGALLYHRIYTGIHFIAYNQNKKKQSESNNETRENIYENTFAEESTV